MFNGLNKVYLLGHIGQDPELRHTTNSSVLNIRMATTGSYLKNNERVESTEWHTVTVWGKRGEALDKLLKKGDKICVEGSLRTRMWESKTGEKRYATDVNASDVFLCGSKTAPSEDQPNSVRGDSDEPPPF